MRKSLRVVEGVLFVALAFMPAILPTITFAQADKSATQDVKDAGHSTKEATKKTGRKAKSGTKKVVNKSATKTVEGAKRSPTRLNRRRLASFVHLELLVPASTCCVRF